jgi:Secretion system C-terminal sorting domain
MILTMKKINILISTLLITSFLFGANQTVINASDSGPNTLRSSLAAVTNGDTIFFDQSLAGITIAVISQLTISTDVVLQGFSSGSTITLGGGNSTRVISILTGTNVTFNWINITEGSASTGAGILNNGTLELNHCKIFGNTSNLNSPNQGGAGIYNNGAGVLTINYCELFNNTAQVISGASQAANAGAIWNRGATTINFSGIYGNKVKHTIDFSPTISSANGGAIYIQQGTVVINSSTISGNTCETIGLNGAANGGGIYNFVGTLTLNNSTLNNNSTNSLYAQSGGGNFLNVGTVFLYNTIIANGVSSTIANDIYGFTGSITSLGNNLIQDTTSSSLVLIAGDILADPILDILAYNNGAFTKTHSLLACSPALNTGDNTNAPTLDQANQTRIFGGTIDIGAFEAQTNIPSPPTLTASAQNTAICLGDTTTITGFIVGTGTYIWDNGLGAGQAQTVFPTNTTTYNVTVTETATGCSNTASVTVTVSPLPTVTTSANPTICEGDSVTITATLSAPGTYFWDNGLGAGQTQIISPTNTTTFTVTGTETATGCFNTSSTTVTVNPLPTVPVITQSGLDLTTGTYNIYQWYLNGNILTGETNQTITPTQNGDYTVIVTSSDSGCSNISAIYTYIITGLKELSNFGVNIYPNPVRDNLNFTNIEFISVSIFNSLGKKMETVGLAKGDNQLTVSELPQGFYVLQFVGKNKMRYNTSFIKN